MVGILLFIHSGIPTVLEDTGSILMLAVWQRQWDITTKHIVRHIHLHQSQESTLRLTWQKSNPLPPLVRGKKLSMN